MKRPATPATHADLDRAGYALHVGQPGDGHLCRRYWWTLYRRGWSGVEVDPDDHASADEAAESARAHMRGDIQIHNEE
jgi:hypothetical protein